jgi:hypothetical protein
MKRAASLLGFVLCAIPAFAVKPTRITVAISPTTATLYSGGTQQFTATRDRSLALLGVDIRGIGAAILGGCL